MNALDRTVSLRNQAYIDGEWIDADSGESIFVANPSTGAVLGTIPNMGAAETKRAIESANAALSGWSARTAKERSALLRRWFDLIMENQEVLASVMTAEQGKPLAEARAEVIYGASFVEWYAEEGKRVYGDMIPHDLHGRRILTVKQPVGVVAAITPWNFPNAMITRKCAPALAAGCTVVIKPATATPYSALILASLAEKANIPKGVFNVVTGSARAIGNELTTNPLVRKVTFTGSTEVGKKLLRDSASTVKKVTMELGGNAPFIIYDDSDLDAAVEGVMASKFRNTGQTCICANRILVQDKIHDAFVEKLKDAVSLLVVADGFDERATQGPLIDGAAVEKVESLVADAVGKGAVVQIGGNRHELGGNFYMPTILTGATPKMNCAREEIFGPVAPIFRFETEDEAIALANDTEFGLAAYFYARDIGRIWRTLEKLEYGIVGVNEGLVSTEVAPFGGVKESGLGREGSSQGIEEFLEVKYACIGGLGNGF